MVSAVYFLDSRIIWDISLWECLRNCLGYIDEGRPAQCEWCRSLTGILAYYKWRKGTEWRVYIYWSLLMRCIQWLPAFATLASPP